MNDLLKEIICDLYTYIKEGELIKNGTRYTVDTIIAPLEPELWGYYKELYGENSLTNNHFCIDTEEKRKKAADVKPKKVPLDDSAFFAEIAQLWIIAKTLGGYSNDYIVDISFCIDDILCKLLEHRLSRKVPYKERTVQLVFDVLETLKEDASAFYREHTRLLCFFQFYRDDINRFFTLLNNLIVNRAYRDSFVRNVGNEKEIDAAKFLPVELNAEEARNMLKLFARRNDRPISLSDHKAYNDPSRYYIYKVEAVAWLFNDYFGFDQHKHTDIFKTLDTRSKADTYKQYFKDAFESLEDKITEFPALTLLLERASRHLTFTELQQYFPCIHESEISHDADIYRSLKVVQIKNGAQYSRFEAILLNTLPNICFKYDVEDSRPFSNKRMMLLQAMFLGALWGLLCTTSGENSEQQKWKKLLDILFRSFSPKSSAAEYAAEVLNRLIELCCIKTEMLFDTVDFTALNKSSYFKSNEALLHLYYSVTHFLTNKKYSLLEQLDFTAEMQRRILPLFPKDEKKKKRDKRRKNDSQKEKEKDAFSKNREFLKQLDCGISFQYFRQPVIPFGDAWSNEVCLMRSNFAFKLWFDSEREYEDLSRLEQSAKDERQEEINRNLNKSCIDNHFFYSADRNMETHFSLHHSVAAVLEKPKRLLYALYDIKQYLERIKEQQPPDSIAVPFLQQKLEHIFSTICLVLFPDSSNKSWDAVFDSKGNISMDDDVIQFDLFKDFGKEFYITVKNFLEVMFTGQSDWMEKLDFELLIYLIYVTLHLIKRDADRTDDIPLIFNCTEDEQKRWQKTADFIQACQSNRDFSSKLTQLLPHPYSVFNYQLSDNIQSKNMKQWQALPQSAIIHLYNGDFEKLPQYVRNMHGLIDDAKQLLELKSIGTSHSIIRENYKKIIAERWNGFARKKFRKTWLDLRSLGSNDYSYGFSFHNNGVCDESYQKLIEIDTFKQKVFYVWCYHVKCQIALAFSDDGLRIDVFLGVKSKKNLTPIYSTTADCDSLERNFFGANEPLKIIFEIMQEYLSPERSPFRVHSYSYRSSEEYDCIEKLRERKSKTDDMLKILCRNIVQECSTDFFKNDVSFGIAVKSKKIAELCKELNECFSLLRQKEENWNQPNWYCMEVSKKPYDLENYPKDQIFVSSGSTTDYPAIQFGIVLSDDDMQMEVYFDFYRTGEEALFTLPVSEYKQFCDFAYAAHNYVKERMLTYQSMEQEVAELKAFHTEVFKYCIEKITEQRKEDFELIPHKSGGIRRICPIIGKPSENNTPLDKLYNLLDPNASKDKFYSFSLNLKGSYCGISTTDKPEEITVPEKPRCVSYSFIIENKDEKTIDDWRAFHIYTDVLLKDNNTELELCLFFDEWDEENNKIYDRSFTIPLAQYTLLPKFLYALYEYWTFNSNTYYEIIEKKSEENGYPHTWKERKPRIKEIAKIFTETAQKIFGKDAKTESLTLPPQAFKERMEALEDPEWQIGSSYSEIIRVNDIPQLVLSTGIDAVHIQLAITFNDLLTELEVYLDKKTDPDEKPLFVLNSTDYRLLASFFAELKVHQVEDMFACKKKLDEHRATLK